MLNKVVELDTAIAHVKNGDTVLVGGFMTNGTPELLMDTLVEKGVTDLTLVCNDAGFIDKGVGKMIMTQQFKTILASHIGLNKEAGRQMNEGITEIELVPQGTLAERIRAGGYGLGGVLTPTGLGTEVAKGKDTLMIDGQEYLIEKPIKGDVALILADTVDTFGNIIYKGSENNFNSVMASNAAITIVEARHIVEVGELDPNQIHTPGIFIDYIVKGGGVT